MARRLPFACPNAGAVGDDTDHVLVAPMPKDGFAPGPELNPFLRYRTLLSPYRLGRGAGLSNDAWAELIGELDDALVALEGHGCCISPMTRQPELAKALGLARNLWIKDETGAVSGSHKARHLIGVMLYLRVLEASGLPLGEGLRKRRLAIASCGNAALAAALIARAARWSLDVFIPVDAEPAAVRRLRELGATITVCERRSGEGGGDPCVRAFRRAVATGALAFGVQGPDNGLAVEGGRILAFEMAEQLRGHGAIDAVLVQVGGGALASALAQGLAMAAAAGVMPCRPRLVTVQAAGCAPLARGWQLLPGVELNAAARQRSRFMWPWETTPASLARGILDDETYDWWEAAKAMRETDGAAVVVDEAALERAHVLARAHTAIDASVTGTAGLAGITAIAGRTDESVATVFSGVERAGE